MAVAALWDTWCDPDGGDIDTGALLTTPANTSLGQIHDRMPAVLAPEDFETWLDTGNVMARDARRLLRPAEDGRLIATPVSSRVNSVANDEADLLQQVEPDEALPAPVRRRKKAATGQDDGGEAGGGQMSLF